MFKSSHNSKTLSQGKKSDLEGGLPTIELPEWWDLLSLSLKVFFSICKKPGSRFPTLEGLGEVCFRLLEGTLQRQVAG